MRTIYKETEPDSLTQWKRRNPQSTYRNLPPQIRQDIRHACAAEQYYLCAYCCAAIDGDRQTCHNEPLEDEELIQIVIDDINTPTNGKFEPFAPVLINVLKSWLSG